MIRFVVGVLVSRLGIAIVILGLLVGLVLETPAILGNPAHPERVRAYDLLTQDFLLKHVAVVGDSYTTGTDEGGQGAKSWTARAWQTLAQRGTQIGGGCGSRGQGRLCACPATTAASSRI